VDLSKLTRSDRIIAGSGIVLFIASFMPWFKLTGPFRDYTANGWDIGFLWGGLPALLGIVSAGIVLGTKLGNMEMPKMSFSSGQAMLVAGAVSAALVVLKLLAGYHSIDRAYGLFLATLAALGLLAGGFLAFQEEKSGSTASG
jgi:hypothetical protein